jgi:hypothetical protein
MAWWRAVLSVQALEAQIMDLKAQVASLQSQVSELEGLRAELAAKERELAAAGQGVVPEQVVKAEREEAARALAVKDKELKAAQVWLLYRQRAGSLCCSWIRKAALGICALRRLK